MDGVNLGSVFYEFQAKLDQFERQLSEAASMISEFEAKAAGSTKAAASMEGGFASAGSAAKSFATELAGIGLAVAGGAYAVDKLMQSYSDFETEIQRAGANVQATKEQLEDFRKVAIESARGTSFSATEAANALFFLAGGSVSAADAADALGKTIKFANANQVDLREATLLTSQVMQVFKIRGEDLTSVMDKITKAGQISYATTSQLQNALQEAAPSAARLGISFEDLLTVTSALADVGVLGSEAGVALKRSMTELLSPSDSAIEALNSLGITVDSLQGILAGPTGLSDVIILLQERLKGIQDPVKQTKILMDIFGQGAGPAMAATLGLGSEALLDYRSAWEEAGNAMEDTNGRIEEAENPTKILKDAMFELGIAIATVIAPAVKFLSEKLVELVKWIGTVIEWFQKHDAFVKTVVIPTIIVLGSTLAALYVQSKLALFFQLAMAGFNAITGGMGGAALAAGGLRGALFALQAAIPVLAALAAAIATVSFAYREAISLKNQLEGERASIESQGKLYETLTGKIVENRDLLKSTNQEEVKLGKLRQQQHQLLYKLNDANQQWTGEDAKRLVAVRDQITAQKEVLGTHTATVETMTDEQKLAESIADLQKRAGQGTTPLDKDSKKGASAAKKAQSDALKDFNDLVDLLQESVDLRLQFFETGIESTERYGEAVKDTTVDVADLKDAYTAAMDDITNKLKELEDSHDNANEKLQEAIDLAYSYGEAQTAANFDAIESYDDLLAQLDKVHDRISDIVSELKKIDDQSKKNADTYEQKAVKAIVDAEEKIKKLRADLSKAQSAERPNTDRISELQKQIRDEQAILAYAKKNEIGNSEEIKEERKKRSMNELELLKYNFDQEQKNLEERKASLQAELVGQLYLVEQARQAEVALYEKNKSAIIALEEEITKNYQSNLNTRMAATTAHVNQMDAEYQRLKVIVQQTLALQAQLRSATAASATTTVSTSKSSKSSGSSGTVVNVNNPQINYPADVGALGQRLAFEIR